MFFCAKLLRNHASCDEAAAVVLSLQEVRTLLLGMFNIGGAQVKESSVLRAIMLALGNVADFRVWRNNSGALQDVTGRLVKYGLAPGSADLVGILAPTGRLVALEVKTDRRGSKQTPDQENWGRVVREMGGVYEVVRSVEEALNVLEQARRPAGTMPGLP